MISIVLFIFTLIAIIISSFKIKEKLLVIGSYICTIILLIQVVTIGILFIQSKLENTERNKDVVVTDEKMFDLSKDENILVFVLDSFDSFIMKDFLESEIGEEYKDIFKDFTYYPDTVGAAATTQLGLPYILTGELYLNDKLYRDYLVEAYNNNDIYKAFDKRKYSLGVYTYSHFLERDNTKYINAKKDKYIIKDFYQFCKKFYNLVIFNYMPHQFKKYFFISTSDFEQLKTIKNKYNSYDWTMQAFYKKLQEEGIKVGDTSKAFRMYHLDGIHPPYTFDKNLVTEDGKEYLPQDEAEGNMKVIKQYLKDLKEAGVYNQTTIVIMADHGQFPIQQNPIFMIKNKNESHPLKVSEKEMFYGIWKEILIKLINGDVIDEEVIENLEKSIEERKFYYYAWDDGLAHKGYINGLIEYVVKGNAMDMNNAVPSGKIYIPHKDIEDYLYPIGKKLLFGKEDTSIQYITSGFSAATGDLKWIDSQYATMRFYLDEEFEDLKLNMEYSTYTESQHVIIYANDHEIANYIAEGDESKEIEIPREYIVDKELILKFKLPDATSPSNRGNMHDRRILSLAMKTLMISHIN